MQLLWACCQELTNKVEKDESGAGGANNINMHLQSQETIWMCYFRSLSHAVKESRKLTS